MAVPGTAIHNLTLWPTGLVSAERQPSLAVLVNLLYAAISSPVKIAPSNSIGKKNTVSETAHRRQHYCLTGRHIHTIASGSQAATVLLPGGAVPADDAS